MLKNYFPKETVGILGWEYFLYNADTWKKICPIKNLIQTNLITYTAVFCQSK